MAQGNFSDRRSYCTSRFMWGRVAIFITVSSHEHHVISNNQQHGGNLPVTGGSLHIWPVMWKVFPWQNSNMSAVWWSMHTAMCGLNLVTQPGINLVNHKGLASLTSILIFPGTEMWHLIETESLQRIKPNEKFNKNIGLHRSNKDSKELVSFGHSLLDINDIIAMINLVDTQGDRNLHTGGIVINCWSCP